MLFQKRLTLSDQHYSDTKLDENNYYRPVILLPTAAGVLLPPAILQAKFQRQRFGDEGKDSLSKNFTILE